MGKELLQKVAYIGLRNPDGTYLVNVPLYIKVTELNKFGVTDMQEEIIHRIAEKMMRRYEKQIAEFIQNGSKEQGVNDGEDSISG